MTNKYTAIVLSAEPVTLEIPGVVVLGRTHTLKTEAELHAARLDALLAVRTPYCFYLDDDDELPADYLDVLGECAGRNKALTYTGELAVTDGQQSYIPAHSYRRSEHLRHPTMVHHLALMKSDQARSVAAQLPRGDYWTEMLLYFQLAKRGVANVDRVGYVWNRSTNGFSRRPKMLIAQVASATWCARNT